MGTAIASRVAKGRKILLGDFSGDALDRAAKTLGDEGHVVETCRLDVSDHASVVKFAETAAQAGQLDAVVHTAGLSPAQAAASRVFAVDLLGTANVIDAFHKVATPGLAMVCIASVASHLGSPLSTEFEEHLAVAPLDTLLQNEHINSITVEDSSPKAYAVAKRGNILRVQAAAPAWGLKGARINSLSPGVISTAMLDVEMETSAKAEIDYLVGRSAAKKMGSPEDVANGVEFLISPTSSFVTGIDLVVDGGAVSGMFWGEKSVAT